MQRGVRLDHAPHRSVIHRRCTAVSVCSGPCASRTGAARGPLPNALSPVCDTLGLERDRAIMGLWLARIGTAERAQVHCGRTIIFMPCVAAPSAL